MYGTLVTTTLYSTDSSFDHLVSAQNERFDGDARCFGGLRASAPFYLRDARTRRNVTTSRSNSIGLVSKSLHPAASAFSRSPASACAERAIIGISRVV